MTTEIIIEDQNLYRLVWVDPDVLTPQYGTFLFNSPDEAQSTIKEMEEAFPFHAIWLEDREHNLIEVQ